MKRLLLIMMLALMTGLAQAQNILGKWITEAGDAQVEIYRQGDKFNGKIVWMEKDKLKVRGYLGPFYETQTWTRKQ